MTSMSVRVTYRTAENSLGHSRLWFSSSTKSDFRKTLHRHRIEPESIFKFEVNKGAGYEERPLESLLEIVREGKNDV